MMRALFSYQPAQGHDFDAQPGFSPGWTQRPHHHPCQSLQQKPLQALAPLPFRARARRPGSEHRTRSHHLAKHETALQAGHSRERMETCESPPHQCLHRGGYRPRTHHGYATVPTSPARNAGRSDSDKSRHRQTYSDYPIHQKQSRTYTHRQDQSLAHPDNLSCHRPDSKAIDGCAGGKRDALLDQHANSGISQNRQCKNAKRLKGPTDILHDRRG